MKPETVFIDWDSLPELLTKEQFYRLAHISKNTARELLLNGTVPCVNNGKKSHCYLIRKEDVRAYIYGMSDDEPKDSDPSYLREGKYKDISDLAGSITDETKEYLHAYYTLLLKDYPDVLTTSQLHTLTGYTIHTINNWCKDGKLQSSLCLNAHRIPKVFLLDFLCGAYFRGIARKSEWHKMTLTNFLESLQII